MKFSCNPSIHSDQKLSFSTLFFIGVAILNIGPNILEASPAPSKNDTVPAGTFGEKDAPYNQDSTKHQGPYEQTNTRVSLNDGIQEGPYENGGMPLMSDSLFSLIILIYVSVAFLFVFFMFCWKNGNSESGGGMGSKETNGNLSCPLMSLEDIIGGKRQQDKPQNIMMKILSDDLDEEFSINSMVGQPTIIPPTPSPSSPIPISKLPCVNEDVETDDDETTSLTTNGRNSSGERI